MPLSLSGLIDRWLSPAPAPDRIGWIAGAEFAHRGLHGADRPENSPTAFAAAIARGMGIECDVQQTQDNEAVVFHDFTLERLTGEQGPVATRAAADIQRITLTGSADTIPSLRQLLDQVASQVPILIEVKTRGDRGVAALCRAVQQALQGYSGPHGVMSFDPRVSRWFRAHSPATPRGLVMTEEDDKPLIGALRRHIWLWIARPDFLAYDIRDLPSRFATAQRRRGLPVTTWTVRTPELRERALLHADAPITEGAGVS